MEHGMECGVEKGQLLQKVSLNIDLHLAEKLHNEAFLSQMYEKFGR